MSKPTPSSQTARTKNANAKDREDPKAQTGRTTRQKNGTGFIVEELENIKNAKKGREYLETNSLLVPAGMPITTAMAASCLHQITIMAPGIPTIVIDAIRGMAFLLDEIDTTVATQTYHDGFNAELDNFTTELGQLVTDTQAKVDLQLAELAKATTQLTRTVNEAGPQTQSLSQMQGINHAHTATPGQPTYSQVLVQSPKELDPRMLSRHNIRKRQIMLDGVEKESRFGKMGDREMKEEINKQLKALKAGDLVRARATTRQRNGGVLLEMDSDYGAAWTRTRENISKLCAAIGGQVTTKQRSYNLIAKFAPLSAPLEDETFMKEVQDANNLDDGIITSMRWLKPLHRRKKGQICGHIILKVTDATEANRMITLGMYVANKKLTVEKCNVDPVRCLKCQGYNHFAKECVVNHDICGHCGERGHRTSACTNTTKVHCTSCNMDDHPSYDRYCPTFLRKVADKNSITPENNLPFIQTDEAWTWNKTVDDRKHVSDLGLNYNHPAPAIFYQQGNQYERSQQRKHQMNQKPGSGHDGGPPRWEDPPPLTQEDDEGYQQWAQPATNIPDFE